MPNRKFYSDKIECGYDVNDKARNIDAYIRYFLARTQTMFMYENLPPTIPQREFERLIQCIGWVCIAEHEGNLYAFRSGLGGKPDEYYRPTKCIVANPALNLSKSYTIGADCTIIRNDSYLTGLLPLISRYSSLLAENDISLRLADINSRIVSLITAPDGNTNLSAQKYLEKIESGKIGVIADESFLDGLKTQPYANASTSGTITDLIELHQYLKASCFNELGINSNYNMKREALNTEESQLNHDALIPLVEDMLQCRQSGVEKVNEMFGTNIRVELGGVWRDLRRATDVGTGVSRVNK